MVSRVTDTPLRALDVRTEDDRTSDAPSAGVFDVRDLTVRYDGVAAVRDVTLAGAGARGDRVHRAVRLRQEHDPARPSTA